MTVSGAKRIGLKINDLRKGGKLEKRGTPKMEVFLEMCMKTKGEKIRPRYFSRC